MSRPEDGEKVRLVPRFVRQETVNIRGKSTCYATSIVNAAISLGAITLADAQEQHTTIVDDLIAVPDLWNGSLQRIQTLDPRIAEIIEKHLPVRVGFDSEIGRLMTVGRSFGQIWNDVVSKNAAYVITVPQAIHAYAVTKAGLWEGEDALVYVDPLDPYTTHIGTKQWFNKVFHPDNRGEVVTTPVRERVRVR